MLLQMQIRLQQQNFLSQIFMKRITRQRREILRCFAGTKRALSIEEILNFAIKEIPGISLSTVYRNLKTLIQEGKIRTVELPGNGVRYEVLEKSHHHHFLCCKCDKLFNINGCPKDLIDLVPKGFELHSHSITLCGLCNACVMQ